MEIYHKKGNESFNAYWIIINLKNYIHLLKQQIEFYFFITHIDSKCIAYKVVAVYRTG